MPAQLETQVQFVKGVGPNRARILEKAGIHTAEDLLKYRPFRYEDRTHFKKIAQVKVEEETVVQGKVSVVGSYSTPRKRVRIFEMVLSDETGGIGVKFFNQPYLEKVLKKDQEVVLFGVPRIDSYSRAISFINPEFEILDSEKDTLHTGRIVPVYRRIGHLTAKILRQILYGLVNDLPGDSDDPLPQALRTKYGFPERMSAFRRLHFPEAPEQQRQEFLESLENEQTPSHRRLIFEEFFEFQLGLKLVRARRKLLPKDRTIRPNQRVREVIKSMLPFHPTSAQKRVLKEIVDDICGSQVMNRLLQGDVGSGKTIVALQALLLVIENGFQTVLMAPTEILAEQHYRDVSRYLRDFPYRVAFLSGNVKGRERTKLLQRIQSGDVDLLIGTHALIQKGVNFHRLGMIVVDEQHRFGVLQRSQLMEKGEHPDTLVMTATPIPRTLALTVYGDLDISILDELPPGRQPIKTVVKNERSRSEVYRVFREQLEKGRQAYIVYPIIEESEKLDLKAATTMARKLKKVFTPHPVGLLHGRMKPEEKDELMRSFRAGDVRILVSTTVVEVGIDVPNATLMIIEHAERFGLSQLHQLRGRIGRGSHASLCVLMVDRVHSKDAFARLDIMRRTNDGFKIAEKDLELRGPGEFVGTRQSGLPDFRFGNIVRDRHLLEVARDEAETYLQQLFAATSPSDREDMSPLIDRWKQRYGLFQVG